MIVLMVQSKTLAEDQQLTSNDLITALDGLLLIMNTELTTNAQREAIKNAYDT
jgi:hypothetical protein